MKSAIRHFEFKWMLTLTVILGLTLIVYPDPFVDSLHYIFGLGLICFGGYRLINALILKKPGVTVGPGIVNLIMGFVLLFMQQESIAIIGVIWALRSIEEAGQEIDDFIETRHFSFINLVMVLLSITLSVLLMTDPFEHITLHIRFVGVEMISTVILSRNNV